MNVESPSREAAAVSNAPESVYAPVPAVEIDRSSRPALLVLFTGGSLWLVIALILGVLSSIKLHSGDFLAQSPWLTYGRLVAASQNILAYGFASQILLGIALWVLARLGRTHLQGGGFVVVGALFWNLGVLLGTLGILQGDNTGYDWLEFPKYASAILFFSYCLLGICGLLTFHYRSERKLFPSQWFILAALLWFPWIYSTAQLLLIFAPVRGTLQAVVNGWYEVNFFNLWLTALGSAAIFYFLPKLLNRSLFSNEWAAAAFWLLVVFGCWGGVNPGAPVPKWISSVGIAANTMLLLTIVALAYNWYMTLAVGKAPVAKGPPILRFVVLAGFCLVVASLLTVIGSYRSIAKVTLFTFYSSGITQLYIYGFVGMIAAGGIYYIVPRITGAEWPSPGLISTHFWLGAAGVALSAFALIVGGVTHGQALDNPSLSSVEIARSTLPFVGMSTLGGVILLLASLLPLVNLVKILVHCCKTCCTGGNGVRRAATGGRS